MKHLLRQTITVYTESGNPDVDGVQQLSVDKEIKCRHVRKRDYASTSSNISNGDDTRITDMFQIADEALNEGTIIDFEGSKYVVVSSEEWRGANSSQLFGSLIYATNYTPHA